jgi:hypothetical protein
MMKAALLFWFDYRIACAGGWSEASCEWTQIGTDIDGEAVGDH